MKLPFRRDNSDSENLPTEIKEYYQTERRERVGVAWLLALGTLVLTLILATGLFFGGRWAYRKIAGTDKPAKVSQTETSEQSTSTQEASSTTDTTATSSTSTSTPSNTTQSPTPTTTPTPQPAVAVSTTLPNTGPSEVIGVFASVTAAGTVAHSVMLGRRKRS